MIKIRKMIFKVEFSFKLCEYTKTMLKYKTENLVFLVTEGVGPFSGATETRFAVVTEEIFDRYKMPICQIKSYFPDLDGKHSEIEALISEVMLSWKKKDREDIIELLSSDDAKWGCDDCLIDSILKIVDPKYEDELFAIATEIDKNRDKIIEFYRSKNKKKVKYATDDQGYVVVEYTDRCPRILKGDLLNCKKDVVIVQQCNCFSKTAKGLSKAIIQKYPDADFYSKRTSPSRPGSIGVITTKEGASVVGLFAQLKPGRPSFLLKKCDSAEQRQNWFKECLAEIVPSLRKSHVKSETIAFPFGIGCGLAGGDWDEYIKMIEEWTKITPQYNVVIVKLE